ncbi:MAG: alanine--tRNA ligase [Roseivirga sp.]
MQTETIRKKFVQFFEQKKHHHVAAAPIVNKEDPTLMFTNAGMNQFKDIFLNHQPATHPRAISIQPCLRVSGKHNDLEEVGTDTYHHTAFEMLGNWSFGDYFKEEAIRWAWELLTQVYQLPQERLYVTIFGGDEQEQLAPDHDAQTLWERHVAPDRILHCSKQDNFWEMGEVGPCGPCSEIHIDLRPALERQQVPGHTLVNTDHPQVIELWNLVFMQYNRLATGQLERLPAQHVDTGMGLERLARVLQGKDSNYDTDLFAPIIQAIATAAGQVYGQRKEVDIALRVVADHLRAVTLAIADGQTPSNVKAGYVIRRILRRAIRYGYTYLGFETPFMYQLVPLLAQQWQTAYPHLLQQQAYLEKTIQEEEAAFLKTLTSGLHRLDQLMQGLDKSQPIEGGVAFELYDTYGFPLDLTLLIAQEKGFAVDEAGFAQALQAQRQRSKKAAVVEQSDWTVVTEVAQPTFLGYDQLEATTRVVQYRTVKAQGQQAYQLVLAETPFYAEGGGQVGDIGWLVATGEKIPVLDTKKENELILHQVAHLPQDLAAPLQARVDRERRTLTANNHTATHLLHAALRQVLGTHVEQRGSLVNDQLLRFDFSHPTPLGTEMLAPIESMVNDKIRANIPLQEQRQVPLTTAKGMGAAALFGEKYGEHVRVITFDATFSVELCGGTHVPATGQLGFFKIIATASVAAGVRRIEAVTAVAAAQWIQRQLHQLSTLRGLLNNPQDPVHALEQVLQDKAALAKAVAAHEAAHLQSVTTQLRRQVKIVRGIHTLVAEVALPNPAALKQVTTALKSVGTPYYVVLAASVAQKPYIAVALSEDLARQWPQNARDIVKVLVVPIQGGGGGQPTFATAGGKEIGGLPQVIKMAEEVLENLYIANRK